MFKAAKMPAFRGVLFGDRNSSNLATLFFIVLLLSTTAVLPHAIDTAAVKTNISGSHTWQTSGSVEKAQTEGYISPDELQWLGSSYNRVKISSKLDRVSVRRPAVIPQCSESGYLYDPNADVCAERDTQAHCGVNMVFDLSYEDAGGFYGACWCLGSYQLCIGRPKVLASNGNRCFEVATQGPCDPGETLVAIDRYNVGCAPDACLYSTPKNAVNVWEQGETFNFTYKNECYMTGTEAFCEPGKIVRFLLPYKSPFCVPRGNVHCIGVFGKGGATSSAQGKCKDGLVEDTTRHICVASVGPWD